MLLVVNPETWTWGNTLAVTALGFGIVLLLLISLVFILKFFGWTMQRIEAPKAPKTPKAPIAEKPSVTSHAPQAANQEPSPEEKAAIAMALSQSGSDDAVAVAYALYLAQKDAKHDIPTAMIALKGHETAWNTKSIGMNNAGF